MSSVETRSRKRRRLAAESSEHNPALDGKEQSGLATARSATVHGYPEPFQDFTTRNYEAPVDSSTTSAPLCRVMESFMHPLHPEAPEGWHALRTLLFLLRFASPSSPEQNQEIYNALDRTQKFCLALLEEWWTGRPQDTFMPKIKQVLFLGALGCGCAPDDSTFTLRFDALMTLAAGKDLVFLHRVARRHAQRLKQIFYNWSEMKKNTEMSYLDPSDDLFDDREIAGRAASDERIGIQALQPYPSIFSPLNHQLKSPCRWLEDSQADSLPWYLWDITLNRTICYAIISHTWGQIREKGAMIRVFGVPWRVLKIRSYDVKKLPRMIKDAGFAERYIWMDLLCIPQDTRVKQLTIFKNAKTAVIWLNNVSSWDNTRSAVAWLGLTALDYDRLDFTIYEKLWNIQKALNVTAILAGRPCELDITKESLASDKETQEPILSSSFTPPSWFTSLWTLQEVTIRPDMILLDKHWRPLTLGDELIITFDNISCLVTAAGVLNSPPEGVETLKSLWHEYVHNLGPRAPAIMPAVGATQWFHGCTIQQFQTRKEASKLVLGRYPLAFVEEVRKLCGASFFTCSCVIATMVYHENQKREQMPNYPLKGTMLPFMPIPGMLIGGLIEPPIFDSSLTDHSSIKDWRIQQDGSVLIHSVGLVASNVSELHVPCQLKCNITSNDPEDPTRRSARVTQNVTLGNWIQRFAGEAHAVCTMFAPNKLAGIILHRSQFANSFIKAGTFFYKVGFPQSVLKKEHDLSMVYMRTVDVNWHVL
ncbi:hypothetical protein BDW74DRAFT_168572 [Aspergillus multicolor]|uniref:uncharacterized protein n=1 Tax=Aspergillus multicolor TaxID=41759 RepID=UPI003CCE4151